MLTVLASLVSGLLGALGSTYYYIQYERTRLKKETLRRFAASRYELIPGAEGSEGNFSQALNEILVVFNDDPDVMDALSEFYEAVHDSGEKVTQRKVVTLFKAMCDATGVKYDEFDDQLLLSPFRLEKGSGAVWRD